MNGKTTRKSFFLGLLMMALTILLVFSTESATAAKCKKAQLTPKIDPVICRPQPKMKKAACSKLIAKCRCQHNIIMKWVPGGGCPKKTPAGTSGCQCASFCDLPCAAKCKKDKSGKCGWFAADGKCKNRFTFETGPVPQCQAPTSSPTEAAEPFPTDSPSEPIVVTAPSTSPITTKPSSTPSTSPITSKPSSTPTKSPAVSTPTTSPITSKPSSTPTKSPAVSTPTTSPITSKPSSTPSTSPITSKPSSTPSTSPITSKPSSTPSTSPITSKPSSTPSTSPITSKPSGSPSTSKPSSTPSTSPTTSSPSSAPTTSKPSASPAVCLNDLPADRIACGNAHSCAINKNNDGKCWGQQLYGRLGNNDWSSDERDRAVSVNNFNSGWKIYTGGEHSCAISTSKYVYCWGHNDDSQLGYDGGDSKVPIWLSLGSGEKAENMCLGDAHTCAVTTSGKVLCWGKNVKKQCGQHDSDDVETPTRVGQSLDKFFVQVACAEESTCALTNDGKVYCWGDNSQGQLGRGTSSGTFETPVLVSNLDSVTSIGAGAEHFCARVTCEGTLKCWGRNDEGQVGKGSTSPSKVTTPVSAHSSYSGIVSFDASEKVTCIVLENGKAYCWGVRSRRGDGSNSDSVNPTLVGGSITTAVEVACGHDHCCIRLNDGSIKCFGEGDSGQLGNGDTDDENTPVTVQNLV